MHIDVEETETKGRYVIRDGQGARAAEMTFSKLGANQIIVDHTEVSDAYRGKGLGADLVRRAVEDARAAGKKIVPLCPFTRGQLERHPEWQDVLAR